MVDKIVTIEGGSGLFDKLAGKKAGGQLLEVSQLPRRARDLVW